MSDFLSTLAARARPIAPPVEPRRVSIFEPSSRDVAPQEPSVEKESVPPAWPGNNQDPNPILPGPDQARSLVTASNPQLIPSAVPAPVVLPPNPPPPSREPAPMPHQQPASEPNANRPPEPLSPLPVHPDSDAPPPPVATREIHSERLTTERILTETQQLLPNLSPSAIPTAPAEPPPPQPLLAPPAVRLIETPSLAAASAVPQAAARQEPPVVRVSIGRVEVRAVVPAQLQVPPPAPARKPNPVISLDDYLKQQSSRSARV